MSTAATLLRERASQINDAWPQEDGRMGGVQTNAGAVCIRHYLGQMCQEAAGRVSHQREGSCQMVVLHRRGIVVPQREHVAAVYEEVVGSAAVLKVVDHLDNQQKRGVKIESGLVGPARLTARFGQRWACAWLGLTAWGRGRCVQGVSSRRLACTL